MRGEILGKKVMGDNIQKMVALFQPGSLTLPVSSPRVSSSSSSSRSGSDTPLVLRRRRPFGDGGHGDDGAGGHVENGAGGHGGADPVKNGAGGHGGADPVDNGAGGGRGADPVDNGAGGRGVDTVENGAGARGTDLVDNSAGARGDDREERRNGQWAKELFLKLKALALKVKTKFSKAKQDALPVTHPQPRPQPQPRPRPSAASPAVKEWREYVEKALANQIALSRLLFFGMMTMGLTILFARRRDITATRLDKVVMSVEMGAIFLTVTVGHYKILCEHLVQTTPRVAKCSERATALVLLLFTLTWMSIYTSRIPHEVFCRWMWIILGFNLAVISIITVYVGFMGGATEDRMIHWEDEPVRNV